MPTRLLVLFLSLWLVGCKTLPVPQTPRVPPSEAVVRCPKVLDRLDFSGVMSQDRQSLLLAQMIELYGECAVRHDALIDYVETP